MGKSRITLNLTPAARLKLRVIALREGTPENRVIERLLDTVQLADWDELAFAFQGQIAAGKDAKEALREFTSRETA